MMAAVEVASPCDQETPSPHVPAYSPLWTLHLYLLALECSPYYDVSIDPAGTTSGRSMMRVDAYNRGTTVKL